MEKIKITGSDQIYEIPEYHSGRRTCAADYFCR